MREDIAPAPRRTLRSSPSLACEICWISVAIRPEWCHEIALIEELLGHRTDLVERVCSFWGDADGDTCFAEMQVLAHHAGALGETNPAALWAALEAALPTVPTDLPLESETPENRLLILERLRRLKESPALFRSYLELLQALWAPVDAVWQPALPLIEMRGREVVAEIEGGRPLHEYMGEACTIFTERYDEICGRVESGYPLLIVPCLLFGRGLYLEFPGLTLIGAGFQRDDMVARARTEGLARRLKTMADPTRLALLHYLAYHPSSVGELAASFGLAQPTVSMHVKSLRESGLVRAERVAGRMRLSANPIAVDALVDELRSVVARGVPIGEELAVEPQGR
jgi:DNA-binding transcriptional ArsR family regulator